MSRRPRKIVEALDPTELYQSLQQVAIDHGNAAHDASDAAWNHHTSGGEVTGEHHGDLAKLHMKAHDLHRAAAHLATGIGDHDAAQDHDTNAEHHDKFWQAHSIGKFPELPQHQYPEGMPDWMKHKHWDEVKKLAKQHYSRLHPDHNPGQDGKAFAAFKREVDTYKQHVTGFREDIDIISYLKHLSYARPVG